MIESNQDKGLRLALKTALWEVHIVVKYARLIIVSQVFESPTSYQTAYWGSRVLCFKLRDHRNFHAKLTDPQLMKENKVTYPHESRIVGHTKQSSMAEDEDVR